MQAMALFPSAYYSAVCLHMFYGFQCKSVNFVYPCKYHIITTVQIHGRMHFDRHDFSYISGIYSDINRNPIYLSFFLIPIVIIVVTAA